MRSICDHTRPDRQTLLFSATFKKRVEKLARDVLVDPIRIVQGDIGEANADVTQIVCVMNQSAKLPWLQRNFVYFLSIGSVLIFVTRKVSFLTLTLGNSTRSLTRITIHTMYYVLCRFEIYSYIAVCVRVSCKLKFIEC